MGWLCPMIGLHSTTGVGRMLRRRCFQSRTPFEGQTMRSQSSCRVREPSDFGVTSSHRLQPQASRGDHVCICFRQSVNWPGEPPPGLFGCATIT
jgi:hypothetical protein